MKGGQIDREGWSVYLKYTPEEAAKEFGLPEQEEVLMLLDLGYPTEDAGPLPNHSNRKELSETVSYL